jgi:hypothetical protein
MCCAAAWVTPAFTQLVPETEQQRSFRHGEFGRDFFGGG